MAKPIIGLIIAIAIVAAKPKKDTMLSALGMLAAKFRKKAAIAPKNNVAMKLVATIIATSRKISTTRNFDKDFSGSIGVFPAAKRQTRVSIHSTLGPTARETRLCSASGCVGFQPSLNPIHARTSVMIGKLLGNSAAV